MKRHLVLCAFMALTTYLQWMTERDFEREYRCSRG